MKVLALNSSPRKEVGFTDALLTPFLGGLESAGARVEKVFLSQKHIHPCAGERACWFKSPGKCIYRDDMTELLPKFAEADIIVFASPVYGDGLSSLMKLFIDRSFPIVRPEVVLHNGRVRHPLRDYAKQDGKTVLISVSGFPELDNFDPLIANIRALSDNLWRHYAGALLRPHANILERLKNQGHEVDSVYEAARRAGYELGETGEMKPETLRAVSREIVTREAYVFDTNRRIAEMLNKQQV